MSKYGDLTKDLIQGLATLRKISLEFEKRLFPVDMSQTEKDILYAARIVASNSQDGRFHSSTVLQSPICEGLTRSTFQRAVRRLTERGYFENIMPEGGVSGRFSGLYILGETYRKAQEIARAEAETAVLSDDLDESVSVVCSYGGRGF